MVRRTVRLLGTLLIAASCGESPQEEAADAAPACTHQGYDPEQQTAERDDDLGVLFYTALRGPETNQDRLTFDFYFPLGASDGPQTVTFTGENLRDCHTCMVARRDCESPRCADGKAFLIQSGTATITAMDAHGGAFSGTLESAVFAEVTIAAPSLETTLVPGGETWCIDSLDLSASVTPPL